MICHADKLNCFATLRLNLRCLHALLFNIKTMTYIKETLDFILPDLWQPNTADLHPVHCMICRKKVPDVYERPERIIEE